jgi:Putative transposase of IS4/5 family (DUF4096)
MIRDWFWGGSWDASDGLSNDGARCRTVSVKNRSGLRSCVLPLTARFGEQGSFWLPLLGIQYVDRAAPRDIKSGDLSSAQQLVRAGDPPDFTARRGPGDLAPTTKMRLTNDECAYFEFFQIRRGDRPPRIHRRVFDAVVRLLRIGGPWRDLPKDLSNWNLFFRKSRRWADPGV